jgi:hypothetical protein
MLEQSLRIFYRVAIPGLDEKYNLNLGVEGSGYYLILLLLRQLNKVDRITAYTNGKLGIFFGMSLSVKERFLGENVNVQVVSALLNVAIEERNEIIYLILCSCHIMFLS